MFDIMTQAVTDTAVIHVKNAAGEPLYADDAREKPVQIVVYGPGSTAFAEVESRQSQRALKRMEANEGKITLGTAEERLQETAEDLASLTVAFNNFTYSPEPELQGAPLFTAVYANRKLGFISSQVSKQIADWGKFKPASRGS